MSMPSFRDFLNTARKHDVLLIDLCAEEDLISRARLLNYLGQHNVRPDEKERLIDQLVRSAILLVEGDQSYTINPVVIDLVNYYERRGRLTSATFLREQIVAIARLTDRLQQYLVAEEKHPELILDTVDDLYRLIRQVREAGDSHYMACMRLFGDMKRTGDAKTIDQRIKDLRTAQRRHIDPLREFIDPDSEYAQRINALRRRMAQLSAESTLLAQSHELDNRRRRLVIDLRYLDHVLLWKFSIIARTAVALLDSLLDERKIKKAIAHCLGNLDATLQHIQEITVVAKSHRTFQAPSSDELQAFFVKVLQRQLLPNPRPLTVDDVAIQSGEEFLIQEKEIWHFVRDAGRIGSWPRQVVEQFADYSGKAQLRAMVFPLVTLHPQVNIIVDSSTFEHAFDNFSVHMHNFGLQWESET
jgi:hypothetical protein